LCLTSPVFTFATTRVERETVTVHASYAMLAMLAVTFSKAWVASSCFSAAKRQRKHVHPGGQFSSLRLHGYLGLRLCSEHGRSLPTPLRVVPNRILYLRPSTCASRRWHVGTIRTVSYDSMLLFYRHRITGKMRADVVVCHCSHLWHGSSAMLWDADVAKLFGDR
jgi:hypothetical protein